MRAMTTVSGRKRWRLSLRTRATVGFGITGLLVAVGLAVVTYGVARSYLVDQREDAAVSQAYTNARLVRSVLRSPSPDVRGLLTGVGGGTASESVLRYRDQWFATSVAFSPDALPQDLVRVVSDGHAGHQRYRDQNGEPRLAVAVPIATARASYFEVFSLDELDKTLDLLTKSLLFGVLAAAVVAAAVGRAAAARLVRPLAPVADAAERIAAGALDTRLTDVPDPDLERLSVAFNSMAESLEERIDREARFAADVSHELRSPLTAVAAAMEIIERRREQLPPQVIEAFSVLHEKVDTFQRTVLELLEISRMDAGTATLSQDPIDVAHLIARVLELHGAGGAEVVFDAGAPTHIVADRRRLAQAMGNIVDNARRYAGGTTAVTVTPAEAGFMRIFFDDRGAGVDSGEQDAIFGRFARGQAGRATGSTSGTGLGLSLVAEHIKLHGGRVWVENNPSGGARFVIELPVQEP
jgi:two-component system sensor histidine kinase MtrB